MDINGTIPAHPYEDCHEINVYCTVQMTTLGYFPNAGINYFFAIGFGAAALAIVVLGMWKRTWGYSAFVGAGAALELAGYAARIPLHSNPWNQQAFETQICAIVLGPTLICIGIYLTLQHICLALCPGLSRIRPTWYPWIFVPADVSCLLVQAIGGALAASAGYTNLALLNSGNRAIIAGIALQVAVLTAFGLASLDYYLRVRRWIRGATVSGGARVPPPTPEVLALWRNKRFRTFVRAVAAAYTCILLRCIYRIAEMAGSWGNKIMQDEPSFIVLEGFMILFAVWFLTAFPPGILFPNMAITRKQRKAAAAAGDTGDTTDAHVAADDTEGEKKNLSRAANDIEAGTAAAPTELEK